VIHCTVLFSQVCLSKRAQIREKDTQGSTSQNGKGPNSGKGERSLGGLFSSAVLGAPHPRRGAGGRTKAPRQRQDPNRRSATGRRASSPRPSLERPESCISS